jgi:protoheme IX farnesyltransferase
MELNKSLELTEDSSIKLRDFVELCKPKVVLLMLLTVLVGALLSQSGSPDLWILSVAMIGIGFCAASAAAINHVIDEHIDGVMARTRRRPVATGRLTRQQALLFALSLALIGMSLLLIFVNQITAWLTLLSLIGYAVVYTMFLKRATPQNITIGGLAGAMPPLLGWTAMTGELHANALLLVLIIFAWTPPHFWALAIHKRDEYAKAGIPMLPVTHGVDFTRIQIVLYSLLMLAATLLPVMTGMSSLIYLVGIMILNLRHFWMLTKIFDESDQQAPFQLFKYSIKYLFWLFLIILMDHYLM